MYRVDLRSRFAEALDRDAHPKPAPGDRLAGVLVPIVEPADDTGDAKIVLTRRTEHLPRHPGEISFPGGIRHEADADLRATALRESDEELGLPPSAVEILGALPAVHTFVSRILIVPFVGMLTGRPAFRPHAGEIAEVLEFGLADLLGAEATVSFERDGSVYRGYAYDMGDHTIWGATARILHDVLDIVRGERGAAMEAR
jgi:8-oxo-dGTP pyrophosphatase MutT (NUDIX family)